jgi:thiopeptide-type bacteriocin biosynthesis protein
MAREPIADEALTAGRAVLRRRSEKLAPIAAALREAEAAGRLSVPIPELAQSLLHMQMNRLLRAAARAQECVLYDFLHRLYRSQAARKA